MRPVVFDGCFGWLHPATGEQGVVLCNPFGYDALCTHRGWRRLAEGLAAAGMPVLRFDYPGTGDSAGFEDDPLRVDAWLDSIVAATRRLREWTGVTRVSLVGLRLGAMLAALAAQRAGDIDALVLLAPTVTGRNYLRELRAHRQSWLSTPAGMNADALDDPSGYVEAFGFGLHGDDIARLDAIDLRRETRTPAARVLLLEANDRARMASLAAHYGQHGVAVERQPFDECDRFVIEPLYSETPVDAFERVSAWLAQRASPCADEPAAAVCGDTGKPSLPVGHATEHAVVFGRYFGIYCEPAAPRVDAPAMLFVNTGASHHVGDGRIFVLFARRLAALGIASLRMDLGGLGDAVPAADAVTIATVHSHDASRDVEAGVEWLAARGHAEVALFGVCSGAFVGLQACARHPRIIGAYGVNLGRFVWDGAAGNPGAHQFASSSVYWRAALEPRKWLRAVHGPGHLRRVVAVLARRAAQSGWRVAADWVERLTGLPVASNEVRVLVRTLHAKGVSLRLAYGEFDVGLDEARIQFGPRLGALQRYPRIRAVILPKLDHALFTRPAREAAMADAQRWLFAEVLRSAPPQVARAATPASEVLVLAATVATAAAVATVTTAAAIAAAPGGMD